MPSRIDEAGHTKAFDYSVAEHWGEIQNVQFRRGVRDTPLGFVYLLEVGMLGFREKSFFPSL